MAEKLMPGFVLQSRLHRSAGYFSEDAHRRVFIKRDDELSSGITGSKYRKFASLLPHLLAEKYDGILLIGSSQSNSAAGLIQLLIEHRLPYRMVLLKPNEEALRGNRLWMHLLNPDPGNIEWLSRDEWKDVNEKADTWAAAQTVAGKRVYIVREGAAVKESMPGAMTLATDILRNEKESGTSFRHIFIDSGTGTSAIGLLAGLADAEVTDKTIHITLIAASEEEFKERYNALNPGVKYKGEILFHYPLIAPSFGSITRAVLDEVRALTSSEGILVDPVYTAKHFFTAREVIKKDGLQGDVLVIHSGGALGVAGFSEQLSQ